MTQVDDTPYVGAGIGADEDISWMKNALCPNYDPDLWHPPYDAPSSTAYPKSICRRCPVMGECLDWALNHGENGVWGGTSEADRRALKRRKSRPTCVICESEDILDTEGNEICLGCGASWRV